MSTFRRFAKRVLGKSSGRRVLEVRGVPVVLGHGAAVAPDCEFGGVNALGSKTRLINTTVGRYTYFARRCRFSSVTIGSFCSIGPEVLCGLGTHPTSGYASTHPIFYSAVSPVPDRFVKETRLEEAIPVEIGHDVWIGARAVVLDGVSIGHGAVIAAGAIVTRDVEPYQVVGGVPARPIRSRFPADVVERLLELRWWDRDIDWIREHAKAFSNVDELLRSEEPR